MSGRYPANVISPTAAAPAGPYDKSAAYGVWSISDAAYWRGQGTWPIPGNKQPNLFGWGNNYYGQLGFKSATYYISSPVQVGSATTWTKVRTASQSSIGVRSDGTLWTSGYNNYGQLGLGNTTTYSSFKQVGALTTWADVSISYNGSAYAIKTNGTLWSWGRNNYGQLGLNDTTDRSSPVQVGALTDWLKVSAGYSEVLAIKTNGTLWAWGLGNNGQLGLTNTYNYSSPKQVGSLTTWAYVFTSDWYSPATFAIKTDGTLWAWGNNSEGQLGLGNKTSYSSPKQVGSLTNWSVVTPGYYWAAAVKTDNTLWTWGYNNYGQLGLGNTTNYSSPKQVGALTNWQTVYAGQSSSSYGLAIKTDGSLWAWGYNGNGQLGNNTTTASNSPIQSGSATNWNSVATGYNSVLGIINN